MSEREPPVSSEALEDGAQRLAHLEDVCIEEEGTIPPWLIAVRHAVRKELRRVKHEQ